jgi:hypothetical protein
MEMTYNDSEIIESMVNCLTWYEDFKVFKKFQTILPQAYLSFVETDERFKLKLDDVFKAEIRAANSGNVDYTIASVAFIENEYKIDLSYNKEELQKIKESAEKENPVDWDDKVVEGDETSEEDEDLEIINLFESFADI